MQNTQLFVEILTEELPALPFLKEFKNFEGKWNEALRNQRIEASVKFYYTPRRVVIFSPDFPPQTKEDIQEVYGPPIVIAFENGNPSGKMTQAGEAFLKKNQLERENLEFVQKDGKEVLFCTKKIAGIETEKLLPSIVNAFLHSLQFGKPMRWGDVSDSFIRPIRNVMIFLDSTFIQFCGYGIQSKPQTLLCRGSGYEWAEISSFCQYQEIMEQAGVVIHQEERRRVVLDQIAAIARESRIDVELDSELLDEVVAITEMPKALLGKFDAKFLDLPKEIIITSMKENQRYFAVYEDSTHQKLKNYFVVVSNTVCRDCSFILSGNEKVLRARLEDAMFFYQNDLAKGLCPDELRKIGFIDGAGNMWDKTQRESKIADFIARTYAKEANVKDLLEAIWLSKADLLSDVVSEFSSLQGIMGDYYVLAMGRLKEVGLAIREQYMPLGDNSELPSSLLGALVALSYRLDNILTLFANGKIPTGSKDPFALRRAASGVIKIALAFELDFKLNELLESLCGILGIEAVYAKRIQEFFYERLEGIFDVNASIIRAVLAGKQAGLCEIAKRIEALNEAIVSEKTDYVSTFKRVANILKDRKDNLEIEISKDLLKEDMERELWQAYEKIRTDPSLYTQEGRIKDYRAYMEALSGLRMQLDKFFDSVLVNVEDTKLKDNRIALISNIYCAFLQVADMKEISV